MKKIMIFAFLAALAGCRGGTEQDGVFRAAVWNVQTLFDGEETGDEYSGFLSRDGWNGEKYRARLNTLAGAIARIGPAAPDILGLVEVENLTVLNDLAAGELARAGYRWTAFAGAPGAALGAGVLSRLPLRETRVHSAVSGGAAIPRPVLEVRVETADGTEAVFFVCHWKSKIGGDAATEPLRRAAARVISRRLAELQAEEPELPVVVMGDLNEPHDEFRRRGGEAVTALMPDAPDAAALAAREAVFPGAADFLVITGETPPAAASFGGPALFSPWEAASDGMGDGTYYYRGEWEAIDHFLLGAALFDGKGWEFASCAAAREPPFTGERGTPLRYNPRTGQGLSDHLPLCLLLKRE